jgi:hypothetical protein
VKCSVKLSGVRNILRRKTVVWCCVVECCLVESCRVPYSLLQIRGVPYSLLQIRGDP